MRGLKEDFMSTKRWVALLIAAALFFTSILFKIAVSITTGTFNNWENVVMPEDEFEEKVIEKGNADKKIVVLDISGVIQDTGEVSGLLQSSEYNHREFLKMLKNAGSDHDVAGIILRVNSPGGGVVESEEIHSKIEEVKKKYKKPIYVSMGSMAASGGYYISTPATKIFASPATMTGSLGVIIQSMNYGELAKKFGVKWNTIKSGPYKDIMSPAREMTKKEKDIMQSMVNNAYDQFVHVISKGRHIPEEEVRKIADGRIYDGLQAKKLHLVDEIGSFDDCLQAMKKATGKRDARVVSYEQSIGLNSLLSMGMQKMISPNKDLLGIKELLSKPQAPTIKYLYTE